MMKAGRLALVIGCGVVAAAAAATAAPGPGPQADGQRIAEARLAAEASYQQHQKECLQRFVVTSCLDEAKRQRRETLTRLRQEQNDLDDWVRRSRVAERSEAIRQQEGAAEERGARAVSQEARPGRERREVPRKTASRRSEVQAEEVPSNGRPGVGPRQPSASGAKAPASRADHAMRAERERRSRASYEAVQHAAEARRAEVEARNARRAASRKPAAPLPVPGGP